MADKIKAKDAVNPFARPQFQPPKKKPSKSWSDTIGDSLLYVGDYLRGVKRK